MLETFTKVQYAEPPEDIKLAVTDGWLESPFEEWPGGVIVHKRPSAELMLKWHESLPEDDAELAKDERPVAFIHYEQRRPFVKSWHINGISDAMTKGDGSLLPDYRLMVWLNGQTLGVINDARDPFGLVRKSLTTSVSSTTVD